MRNEDPVAAKGSSYNRRMKRETQASNDEAFKGLLIVKFIRFMLKKFILWYSYKDSYQTVKKFVGGAD